MAQTKSSSIERFSEEVIQSIFGHEAAEDEKPERLKQYYFKSRIFEKVTAPLSLRILVGHKGIGKSALFTVAMHEDRGASRLPILIRPDDILGIGEDASDFLKSIRDWKRGLQEIIAKKSLLSLGLNTDSVIEKLSTFGGKLLAFVHETVKPSSDSKLNLKPAERAVVSHFLEKRSITVYIDDLDRGWQGRRIDIQRISALLNALRDLCHENEGLQFKVSLRSDVYFLVRTSDESTDKIEGSVVWFSWTNHEILALLVKRIETFFGRYADEQLLLDKRQAELARFLQPIMTERFTGHGKWANVSMHKVLMSLIRKRPRDLVKLCTLAARQARDNDRTMIGTEEFQTIFEEYSQGRIQDTINEFKSELPEVERLILNMKPTREERRLGRGWTYRTDELFAKIKNIMGLGRFTYHSGQHADVTDLAHFLYKINFLTARKDLDSGEIDRKYFEENRYLSGKFADFGYDWEVHPAYRWALQPGAFEAIYKQLGVTADEK